MKTLSEIWKEFDKKKGKLNSEGIKDLKWHIENDSYPYAAIAAARDMLIETVERDSLVQAIAPTIAQCFDHKDGDIREIAVGTVISTCEAARYGEQALFLARSDPDRYVRTTALGSLGWVMNKVDSKLAQKMAMHLYYVLTSPDEKQFSCVDKDASEKSILISMGVYYPDWDSVNFDEVWEAFVERYALEKIKGCKGKKKKSKAKYK